MTASTPEPGDADPLAFAPVPTAARHDGWTPERQRRFVAALAVMGVVARAAKAVGMSATSAYKLRARADAAEFAAAWDTALAMGRDRAYDAAVERAINGYTVPRYYRGKQIGTVQRFDHRLVMAALSPPSIHGGRGRR